MATFTYQAKDTAGKDVSGIIEADEARSAATALREQGLFTMHLAPAIGARPATVTLPNPQASAASQDHSGFLNNGLTGTAPLPLKIHAAPFLAEAPLPEMAMMYRQMATLFGAGVPMVQALTVLSNQTGNGRLKKILQEAASTVASGHPFSQVMEQHPTVFSSIHVELIRAGETGGMIEIMCDRLASYLEREIETRRKLKRETLYPKIVLFVAGLVILILSFVQAGMGKQGTDLVVSRVEVAAVIGVIAFGIWWAARFFNQFPAFGAAWDYIKLLIPGPGGVARKYATARFTRAMGALYAGGVNIFRAVEIAARACGNRAICEQLLQHAPALANGEGISGMLARTGLLSPLAVQMARTGEQTGSMDTMMDKVADYLEQEADAKAHQLAVFTGVFCLLLAACVVGYIVISFYAGMFTGIMKEGNS